MSPGARPPPLCYAPVPEHTKREQVPRSLSVFLLSLLFRFGVRALVLLSSWRSTVKAALVRSSAVPVKPYLPFFAISDLTIS